MDISSAKQSLHIITGPNVKQTPFQLSVIITTIYEYQPLSFFLSSANSSLPQALIKQDNLDAFNEKDPYKADDAREDEDDNDDNDNSLEAETFPLERDEVMPPPIPHPPAERVSFPRGLPWAPKVRCCLHVHIFHSFTNS